MSQTDLGAPVDIPMTIIIGDHDGPWVDMTTADNGDLLTVVKVLQAL